MSGFGTFISQNVFGRSNANVSTQPGPGGSGQPPANNGQPYNNGASQLQPQNNNAGTLNGNTGAADPNAADPNNNADPNKGAQGSQLDNFKDLFKIEVDDKGQPIAPPSDPLSTPIMQLDPAKLQAAAKNVSFTQGLTQEQVANAMRDPAALLELINHVGQQSFAQAITVTSKMAETAIQTNNQRFEQALPDRIRSTQLKQATSKNPVLNHPAAAPMLSALRAQISQQNPHLHIDRVSEMADNYFIAMAGDLNNNQQQVQNAAKPKDTSQDWSALLS